MARVPTDQLEEMMRLSFVCTPEIMRRIKSLSGLSTNDNTFLQMCKPETIRSMVAEILLARQDDGTKQ